MKRITKIIPIALIVVMFSSCAALFGGPITEYQRTRPKAGEPQREIRMAALIGDIFFFFPASMIIDFATGAIYRPKRQ